MRIEQLWSILAAQELHLTKRNSEWETKQALKASFVKKNKKQEWLENKKNNGGGTQKSEISNPDEKKHKKFHKGNEKFYKRKV